MAHAIKAGTPLHCNRRLGNDLAEFLEVVS